MRLFQLSAFNNGEKTRIVMQGALAESSSSVLTGIRCCCLIILPFLRFDLPVLKKKEVISCVHYNGISVPDVHLLFCKFHVMVIGEQTDGYNVQNILKYSSF